MERQIRAFDVVLIEIPNAAVYDFKRIGDALSPEIIFYCYLPTEHKWACVEFIERRKVALEGFDRELRKGERIAPFMKSHALAGVAKLTIGLGWGGAKYVITLEDVDEDRDPVGRLCIHVGVPDNAIWSGNLDSLYQPSSYMGRNLVLTPFGE